MVNLGGFPLGDWDADRAPQPGGIRISAVSLDALQEWGWNAPSISPYLAASPPVFSLYTDPQLLIVA